MGKTISKKIEEYLNIKSVFNDYVLRELGLSLNDNNYVVDEEAMTFIRLKNKFIKYNDEVLDPPLKHDEMDLNLIENFRLMEFMFQIYITKYCNEHPELNVRGFLQRNINGSTKGVFAIQYLNNDGVIECIESSPFNNDSVRIFNLICKLNNREHIYDFNKLDVVIDKDTRKKWRLRSYDKS